MYGFVYETTNNINGMKYIGQKIYDKKGNWKTYLGSGIHLKRAVDKYGKENFSRKILEECISKEILDEKEIYWIKSFDAVNSNNYYNIASGGDGGNTIQGFSTERLDELKNCIVKNLFIIIIVFFALVLVFYVAIIGLDFSFSVFFVAF